MRQRLKSCSEKIQRLWLTPREQVLWNENGSLLSYWRRGSGGIGWLVACSPSNILSGDLGEVPVECAPQPCERHCRIFANIVPAHFINEPANTIEFFRRVQDPTGICKLPEMDIPDI